MDERRSNDSGGAISLSYFIRIPNVGDLINPGLVTGITGLSTIHSERKRPHLLAVGSLLGWANAGSHIWGTGMLHSSTDLTGASKARVHAIRGALSLKCLREAGAQISDVPLGDPGILAPDIFCVQKSTRPSHRVGLVCHHTDRYHPILRRFLREDGVTDLSVHLRPEDFLNRMAQCETIFSTSLHGLIFAEALSIPNLWIKGYGESVVDDFKFHDWFTTTARPQKIGYSVRPHSSVLDLAERAELHDSRIDKDALRAAFPKQHLSEIQRHPKRDVSPTRVCRTKPTPVFIIRGSDQNAAARFAKAVKRFGPVELILLEPASKNVESFLTETLSDIGIARKADIPCEESFAYIDGLNAAITDYFSDWSEPTFFIVSNDDDDFGGLSDLSISLFREMLLKHRQIGCVGPMRRAEGATINGASGGHDGVSCEEIDLPSYPSARPGVRLEVATLASTITTSFALHRPGEYVSPKKSALLIWPLVPPMLQHSADSLQNDRFLSW